MKIVLFGDHRDQLIAEHEGDDHPGDRDDNCLGQGADHAKDVAIPALRCLPDLFCDGSSLLIDIGKHGRQIAFNQSNEKGSDRLLNYVEQTGHQELIRTSLPREESIGSRSVRLHPQP